MEKNIKNFSIPSIDNLINYMSFIMGINEKENSDNRDRTLIKISAYGLSF